MVSLFVPCARQSLIVATPITGSISDPLALNPAELIYGATVALGFGTVAAAFILALAGIGTTRGAAALSTFYHAAFAAHLIFRGDAWAQFVHPGAPSGITVDFFLLSHAVFVVLASVLLVLPVPAPSPERHKAH